MQAHKLESVLLVLSLQEKNDICLKTFYMSVCAVNHSGVSLSLVTKKIYGIGIRVQCFSAFFCSSFGRELVNFGYTQKTMAFV